MTAAEHKIAPSAPNLSIDWNEVRRHWPVYSAYALICAGLLLASFSRSIGGLKPDELLLALLAGALGVRRVIRRDLRFAVTAIDAGFAVFILAGTVLPLLTLVVRGNYLTTTDFRGVIGPVEYYLWYRVILEAVPLPQRLPEITRLLLIVLTIVSAVGILQVIHFPEVQKVLVKFFPTYETTESPLVHRATSLVGGWEVLAALTAYVLILINQLQAKEENLLVLGKQWSRWLIVALAINVVALITTLSFTGLFVLAIGYLVSWRLNGQLARATRITFLVGIVAAVLLSPFIVERLLAQYSHHAQSGSLLASLVPQTWQERYAHWQIVSSAVFVDMPTTIFGVLPGFAYPVLAFGSTESLYFLLLYRGGLIYVAGFIFFAAVLCLTLNRMRLRSNGFNRQFLTAALTIITMNMVIDIFDAHLFDAGEAQFLFTIVAVSLGVAQRTDRGQDDEQTSEQTGLRQALPLTLSLRRSRAIVAAILATALAFAAIGGVALAKNRAMPEPPTPMALNGVDAASSIYAENQHLGTSTWELDAGANTTDLVGYAGATSTLPGDTVSLYVSAKAPTVFNVDVYRMGWYYGLGGRLYFTAHHLTAPAQGAWTPNGGLTGCASCAMNPSTHLLDAHWQPTYDLLVPSSWPTGVYLIKLSSLNASPREESYIPLVVRQPDLVKSASQILVVLPVNTYQAENAWGGYSMLGPATTQNPSDSDPNRARQVSFNRPYSQDAGAGGLLDYELHTVRFLERLGYDASYATDIELEADPNLIIGHKAILIPGHSAYWTLSMRDTLETARDTAVDLAFLGADDGEWQARLTPDDAGNADRTLICYKVETGATTPADQLRADPIYASKPVLVTARWRDPAIDRPENALIGLMYGFTVVSTPRYLPPWVVPSGTISPFETVGSIAPGQVISGGLLGGQLDTIQPNGQTPPDLTILAASPVLDVNNQLQTAYSAYYQTSSGEYVFDAGTNWWGDALDELTPPGAEHSNTLAGSLPIVGVTEIMLNTMIGLSGSSIPAGQTLPPPSLTPSSG